MTEALFGFQMQQQQQPEKVLEEEEVEVKVEIKAEAEPEARPERSTRRRTTSPPAKRSRQLIDRKVLVAWYEEKNGLHNSPTDEEKARLAASSGISEKQVDYFLWNRRKRERERTRALHKATRPARRKKNDDDDFDSNDGSDDDEDSNV